MAAKFLPVIAELSAAYSYSYLSGAMQQIGTLGTSTKTSLQQGDQRHTRAGATPSKRYIRLELLIQEQYLKRCRVPKVSIMSTWIPCLSSRFGRYALACTCRPAANSLSYRSLTPCTHASTSLQQSRMPCFTCCIVICLAIFK